jgi:hypothetical protein
VQQQRACFSPIACATLLLAGALAVAPTAGRGQVATASSSESFLLEVIREQYDDAHFGDCGDAPRIVLNEVCSVGTECDPDVSVADFIEVYNPSARALKLNCYVLANDMAQPFVPNGNLAPRGVAAWSESELGFQLAKNRDQVRLYRMHAEDGQPRLALIDLVELADFRAVYTRVPDGEAWQTLSVREAELGAPTSFGKPNP